MTHSFRFSYVTPSSPRVGAAEKELVLYDQDGCLVQMMALDADSLADAGKLAVVGAGYATEAAAHAAGIRWLEAVRAGLVKMALPADFGFWRGPRGGLSRYAREKAQEVDGVDRVLNDGPGVFAYPTGGTTLFASTAANGTVHRDAEGLVEAVAEAWDFRVAAGEREMLAYDLFSGSFFQTSSDARFVMLVTAVEALIPGGDRSATVGRFVDECLQALDCSDLKPGEAQALSGQLAGLKRLSIGQGGQLLADRLGNRTYLDLLPRDFFREAYTLRSDLVHGNHPRPDIADVRRWTGALERYVADLISEMLVSGEA
ncbi:MAG: hypothetical protein WBM50_19115 [Acidimicrobiales bacterium]